jgi:hypothetical protein
MVFWLKNLCCDPAAHPEFFMEGGGVLTLRLYVIYI